MKFFLIILAVIFTTISLTACNTVNKKIDEKTSEEEQKLNKWLNKSESELKINFGHPDKIEFAEEGSRYYFYIKQKYKIKCVRKFEINPSNVVVGFSSKNCF
jgi:hypothetical protein|tara:strand:+ start:528 stop:833 length:306 start_codon:yes stop_codon:yes gene_type:complete